MNTEWRKKIGTSVMVLLITTSFITVCAIPTMAGMPAPAEPWQERGMDRPQHHRSALGIWRDPQTVRELGLSEKQVNQLRDADFASREKQLELKAQLDSFHLQMDKAFSAGSVDDKAVRHFAEEIAGLQGDLFVLNVESRLTVGKILSADQMDMLKRHRLHPEKKGPRRGVKSIASNHQQGRGHHGPPPEAYTACEDKSEGDAAEFVSPRGDTVTGTCEMEGDRLVLRPDNPPDDRGRDDDN